MQVNHQGIQKASGITAATVSPDPSGGFSGSATTFTVTLTGVWEGSVPVRAIVEGSASALVSGEATASGTGVQLTVPDNTYPNPPRTVVFQYQWDGQWIEIDRGVQEEGEEAIELPDVDFVVQSPDPKLKLKWAEAITYCQSLGDGWRLPSMDELRYICYIWMINRPIFAGDAAFATDSAYWSATESSSDSNIAYRVQFTDGIAFTGYKTYSHYVRCVKDKQQ